MFVYQSGPLTVEWVPKTASVAILVGNVVSADDSGAYTNSSSTSTTIKGVSLRTVATTDLDYAQNTYIPVIIPTVATRFTADVYSGTALTTAMIGARRDLYDATSVNAGGTSHYQVTIRDFISAAKAVVSINGAQEYINLS